MRYHAFAILMSSTIVASVSTAHAASLQATPTTVEIKAPGATSSITLKNDGADPINAQVRIFKWSQVNGQEKLEPTSDIVASPPMTSLAAKSDYLVRLVRVSKAPVTGEESYRILVDEIPDTSRLKPGVNVAMRFSIPMFVGPKAANGAKVAWSVERRDGKVLVNAVNNGDQRVRISGLKVSDASGGAIPFGNGLNGYVLARSTMQWVAPGTAGKLSSTGTVTINAMGDTGPIHAQASAQAGR